jgi:aspartate/methionine/tyrosine aminotransferase
MAAPDPLSYFRLKPIQAARVSEISEITAAAPVLPEERVNFHIGNPLQHPRLSSAYLRIAIGLDVAREDLADDDPQALLDALGWGAADRARLEFLIRVIQKSTPYMPRGGYNRKAPTSLVKSFCAWLEKQQEPLQYDLGEQSGRREVIIASGGTREALRVLLQALSDYLVITPANVLCHRYAVLLPEGAFPHLRFEPLADDERLAYEQVEQQVKLFPERPTFVLLGGLLSEDMRRKLRLLSVSAPLFFIEANNAPNHLSLAREAKLVHRVIRLLTPGIFNPRLHSLAPVFLAGNADLLAVIENVHFKMKGSPSASEAELLTFLLDGQVAATPHPAGTAGSDISAWQDPAPSPPAAYGGPLSAISGDNLMLDLSSRLGAHMETLVNDGAGVTGRVLGKLGDKAAALANLVETRWQSGLFDAFAHLDTRDLLGELMNHYSEADWQAHLERSFLAAFVKHQPQYRPEACLVANGSSRTALGILGFHCGITDVVIPDLSWSYEQCFPNVHVVPLTENLALDIEAMIAKIDQLCLADPAWPARGALAINNPHNATGCIFDETGLRRLIAVCLERGMWVVDDLAYQNMAPVRELPLIKTVRQVADDLVREGRLSEADTTRVVTVHSMSKTDCLAGARMAVAEIRDEPLRRRFQAVNGQITPNLAAIFICYLFYRGPVEDARSYWRLRNSLFYERSQALSAACENLPVERNPFGLTIIPPTGSMYPLLHVERLPDGLSLDWLASSLARRGIGLLPLATFARTEDGFDTGRRTFRLTLGGADHAEALLAKTRRLLIDLNRMVAEEDARYNRKALTFHAPQGSLRTQERLEMWDSFAGRLARLVSDGPYQRALAGVPGIDAARLRKELVEAYLPERLDVFRTRFLERAMISDELVQRARQDGGDWLGERMSGEFMKDSLVRRQALFRQRTHDRTVHPTQRYSLRAEMAFDDALAELTALRSPGQALVERVAHECVQEFLGRNVSINSQAEADEILLDFDTLTYGEAYTRLFANTTLTPFLSFWSDWDGSNRPSGQGHRLVASAVMENVRRMAHILDLLRQADPHIPISPELLEEMDRLPERSRSFTGLLNNITQLTHQLEQRYRSILPFSIESTPLQRLATRLHLRRPAAQVLWRHNDRYEQKMLELRRQRRGMLETYFALNKQLRKQLHALIPDLQAQRGNELLLRAVVGYQDILQRIAITPRIHQGMITGRDPFAIDTTVYNMQEINAIAGKYGNPGMTLALQISMSTKAEAVIALDRKMGMQAEQVRRDHPDAELPSVWLIPLFEDLEAVTGIPIYLERVWDYATQSRRPEQTAQNRFAEMFAEVFVAGSDLSQQISQAHAAYQYLKAKYHLQTWLAERGVAEEVRIKLGSGEPMQRQGGYYSEVSGLPAFPEVKKHRRRLAAHLPAAAQRSTAYAVTPLQGVFLGGDLRTFQSSLAEHMRYLPVQQYANLLYHTREAQQTHRRNLVRAAETIAESRLGAQNRAVQELERLTIGVNEPVYDGFLQELTEHFRHILYGRPEDVIGLHIISYFIGRSMPQLRDRPTSRGKAAAGADRGQQILANIAEIIPFARQGSLLRAIAHNQSQTFVLGVNQLTTGLFRALEYYGQKAFPEAERERMIAERILPQLPVYDILHTLRLYQDWPGEFMRRIEPAFPAGNSAFVALREDSDAMQRYLPLFQQELLRRHGLDVSDFIRGGVLIPELLPALRPDLAVLLQEDLFNTHLDRLTGAANGVDPAWMSETARLLRLPEQIRAWRTLIWEVIGDSIYQRVHSFTELAIALYAFSSMRAFSASRPASGPKLSSALSGFIRSARVDDEMRQFLVGAVEYLSAFTEGSIEVPVSIIRALNDVERIAMIEETALSAERQDVLRMAILQIARLGGDNG